MLSCLDPIYRIMDTKKQHWVYYSLSIRISQGICLQKILNRTSTDWCWFNTRFLWYQL